MGVFHCVANSLLKAVQLICSRYELKIKKPNNLGTYVSYTNTFLPIVSIPVSKNCNLKWGKIFIAVHRSALTKKLFTGLSTHTFMQRIVAQKEREKTLPFVKFPCPVV